MDRLSLPAARRIALAAQGFGAPRPSGPVTMRHAQGVLDKVAQFQIDSVNVAVRAHYMPLFSRLGPYDRALLTRMTEQRPRRAFEYWGHAASILDVNLEPALRYRMAKARGEAWQGIVRIEEKYPDLVKRVYDEVAERGPLTAREIEHDEQRSKDNWGWNWSAVKTSLEWLFWQGKVLSAGRNTAFERAYAVPEQVIPPAILAAPTPDDAEAHRMLVRRAARAIGVGTVRCLADYFYLKLAPTRAAIADLVDSGELLPVTIDGWAPAYLWHEARRPRRIEAAALLSPFDSLVFQRERVHRLFNAHYRIEIYVPEAQRQFGYYVYLFLLGERIAARVDLKADRKQSALLVQAAWHEPGDPHDEAVVAPPLAAELQRMAFWLGLERVVVAERGDLATALSRMVGVAAGGSPPLTD